MIQRNMGRFHRDKRGIQLMEFALIMPIFFLLVFGIFEFGRAYFSWIILTNGAREGARAAAVGKDLDEVDGTGVYDRVEQAIVGLPIGLREEELCPSTLERDWCVETDNVLGPPGDSVTVRAGYNFQFHFPGAGALFPGMDLPDGVFRLQAESTMRLE